jgi:hypothetical protein
MSRTGCGAPVSARRRRDRERRRGNRPTGEPGPWHGERGPAGPMAFVRGRLPSQWAKWKPRGAVPLPPLAYPSVSKGRSHRPCGNSSVPTRPGPARPYASRAADSDGRAYPPSSVCAALPCRTTCAPGQEPGLWSRCADGSCRSLRGWACGSRRQSRMVWNMRWWA